MSNLASYEDVYTEMLNSNIVAMSPRPSGNHNIIAGNIHRILGNLRKKRLAIADGMDVYLTEKDRVMPDVMIVCNRDIVKKNGIYGTPDLVVEVLSPSTAKNDRGYKKIFTKSVV